MSRPAVEVADILRAQGNRFLDRYEKNFDFQQLKAFRADQRQVFFPSDDNYFSFSRVSRRHRTCGNVGIAQRFPRAVESGVGFPSARHFHRPLPY
jgi:hypothetical protein